MVWHSLTEREERTERERERRIKRRERKRGREKERGENVGFKREPCVRWTDLSAKSLLFDKSLVHSNTHYTGVSGAS